MNERRARAARPRIHACVTALLLGALVARSALAAWHPYITVYGGASDPVVLRLVPEFRALGCVVRTDASPAPDPGAPAEGDAVVRVTTTAVTFWLTDPASGHAREEGTVAIEDRGPEGIKLASVRVAEIVRARLLGIEPGAASPALAIDAGPPATDAGEPDAPADAASDALEDLDSDAPRTAPAVDDPAAKPDHETSPAVSPPPAHLSTGVGPLLLLASGGTSPALDLALSPAWHPSKSLQLHALLAAPLTAPSVSGMGGAASISTWLAGGAIDWRVSSKDDNWRGTLGGGAAGVISHAQGTASAGYIASSTNAIAALPFVELGGSRGVGSPRTRLGVNGMLGAPLSEIAVQFAGKNVATWGRPVVGGASVALDVDLW